MMDMTTRVAILVEAIMVETIPNGTILMETI